MIKVVFVLFAFLSCTINALAWGGKGHDTICQVATQLVQEEGLKKFIQLHPNVAGHVCNMPDIYWKGNLGPDVAKLGNPTHYVDAEVIGIPIKDMPLDYKAIMDKYTGTENKVTGKKIISIPTELGSNWWRADQFYRLALKNNIKNSRPPANPVEEQNDDLPYNKEVFDYFIHIALMGHFVGDNSQPLHNSSDYDGYATGHGGLHGFYEETVVSYLTPELNGKIYLQALKLQKLAAQKNSKAQSLKQNNVSFLQQDTVLEKMRALAVLSISDLDDLIKLDTVKTPSEIKSEKGMSLKTPAQRDLDASIAKKFEPLIVRHLARSAALLAQLWDKSYVESGRPDLTKYRSYKYPYTYEFIAPDYIK